MEGTQGRYATSKVVGGILQGDIASKTDCFKQTFKDSGIIVWSTRISEASLFAAKVPLTLAILTSSDSQPPFR